MHFTPFDEYLPPLYLPSISVLHYLPPLYESSVLALHSTALLDMFNVLV